jgi:hypothetical protein
VVGAVVERLVNPRGPGERELAGDAAVPMPIVCFKKKLQVGEAVVVQLDAAVVAAGSVALSWPQV